MKSTHCKIRATIAKKCTLIKVRISHFKITKSKRYQQTIIHAIHLIVILLSPSSRYDKTEATCNTETLFNV